MSKDFLGRGWSFPIVPGPTGSLAYSEGDVNVEQSLRTLLLTRTGERLMRGTFGTAIQALVLHPGSAKNLRALEREVRDAVVTWEPRVELLAVEAEQDPGDDRRVLVAISYRVLRTNTRDSMVFPYYLPRAEAP
jgi:uncharacterized protein